MTAGPPVRDRVQVVPLGFEYARLKEPVIRWKADVVVPIDYQDGRDDIPYLQAFLADLEANERIQVDRRSCDIFDLYDTLGTIAAAIVDYGSDDVYVNLSAGSKITAIAGMIACMATGARPIYARPEYGPEASRIPEEPLHEEVGEIFELPSYPIERPSDLLLKIMAYIDSETTEEMNGRYRGVTKKELIEYAKAEEFPFVRESTAETEKGYYRLLDRHVVDRLLQDGYVEIEKVGRKKYLSLTQEGYNVLRAFRHVACSSPERSDTTR